MKVLAGFAKGRSLKPPPKGVYVRPILARIKKSLFDILTPIIPNASFLDLFAGTGAVGIEALSRGAKWVTFVEQDSRCTEVIVQNLKMFHWENKASIVRMDASKGLSAINNQFDLIFLGPPYRDEAKNPMSFSSPTIQSIMKTNLLKPDGWIIGQHHKKEVVDPQGCGIVLFRREFYGDSVLSFFKRPTHD